MIGKGMFLSKKGKSLDNNEIKELAEAKKKQPPCTGYEADYERVTRDEQTDDYAGFPRVSIDDTK